MAHPTTPSPSLRFPSPADLPARGKKTLVDHDDEVSAKNHLVILELEEKEILPKGVVTVAPSGVLRLDLSREDPDQGTMLGLYPTQPPPEKYESQIPSWLREYLIKEMNLFGHGPPSACGSLFDQMVRSGQIGREGSNLSVESTMYLLRCGLTSLRSSATVLRDFCASGDAVCEETYSMEFEHLVHKEIEKLAGWEPSRGINNRLLATRHTTSDEQSPNKRLKLCNESAELPRDMQLILDLGSQGMIMKDLLDDHLDDLVIAPLSRLVKKLDIVCAGLEKQVEEDKKRRLEGDHSSDSGVSACSP